jgi:hypothetical protein
LEQWLAKKGLEVGQKLTDLAVDKLLEELGVASYLLDNPCQRDVHPYMNAAHGWANGNCINLIN